MSVNWKDFEQELKDLLPNTFKDDLYLVKESSLYKNPKSRLVIAIKTKDEARAIFNEMTSIVELINAYNSVSVKDDNLVSKTFKKFLSKQIDDVTIAFDSRSMFFAENSNNIHLNRLTKFLNSKLGKLLDPGEKEPEYLSNEDIWQARLSFGKEEDRREFEKVKESLHQDHGPTDKLFRYLAGKISEHMPKAAMDKFADKVNKVKAIPTDMIKKLPGERKQLLNKSLLRSAESINSNFRIDSRGVL